jgi:hypothetical protein
MQLTSVLAEVPPSNENIQYPDEGDVEEFVAVSGGGFAPYDIFCSMQGVKHVNLELAKPGAIKKRRQKTAVARIYFDAGHCSSTKCNLGSGHLGLCSHMVVSGKRSSRKKGSYVLTTPFMDDLQMHFDDL